MDENNHIDLNQAQLDLEHKKIELEHAKIKLKKQQVNTIANIAVLILVGIFLSLNIESEHFITLMAGAGALLGFTWARGFN